MMRVILYMAVTPNDLIEKEDDDTTWVTENEWKSFSGMIKRAGNMIIGRRTYEIMIKNNEFELSKLDKITTVVMTNDAFLKIHNPDFIFIASSPKTALGILQKKVFKKILVCGGGGLNASFMKENLIDEIYIDVEPIIFGKGIKLFTEADFEAELKLLETKKLSRNEIQLHYKVVKVDRNPTAQSPQSACAEPNQ